jgi:hypothetical protein
MMRWQVFDEEGGAIPSRDGGWVRYEDALEAMAAEGIQGRRDGIVFAAGALREEAAAWEEEVRRNGGIWSDSADRLSRFASDLEDEARRVAGAKDAAAAIQEALRHGTIYAVARARARARALGTSAEIRGALEALADELLREANR